MAKLICGCGYLGLRVARRWLADGHSVYATTRSTDRAMHLQTLGIRPIVTDVTREPKLPNGMDIDTVLVALGFDRSPQQTIEEVYLRGLENVLGAMPDSLQHFIYISSTGVYGQTESDWVDETTPCRPLRAGAQSSFEAEQRLADSDFADRRMILRLAGLYGPGRLPKFEAVQSGRPIDAVPDGCLNLIHIDDAADAVASASNYIASPDTVNISDGHPVVRREFYEELARQLKAPPPKFAEPSVTKPAWHRESSDKRVSNRKFLSLYGRPLKYPTFREGLAAIVAGN